MFKVARFTVNNLTDNCITDCPSPVFSFSMESDEANVMLQEAVLSVNGWTTRTKEQVGIVYDGPALAPFTTYTANLQVKDNKGNTCGAAAVFETGFLGRAWQAAWITDGEYHFTQEKVSPRPLMFRKRFSIDRTDTVKKATLYATALGIYELTLDGRKTGEDYFAPGFTSYTHQLQYQIYDVTAQLTEQSSGQAADKAAHTLTAVVAGGWAVGAYTYKRMNRLYANRQAFLCELHILYEDGRTKVIASDPTWEVTTQGNYRAAEFYDGEIYDATIDPDSIAWHPAQIEKDPRLSWLPQTGEQAADQPESGKTTGIRTTKLIAQYGAPVRRHEVLRPISRTVSPGGELIYDMGQNFAGVIHARLRGRKGQKVVFRHAEILVDERLYTKPLRSARQEAVYICRDGMQEYSPRLTYMGFRYVGVTGIDQNDLELEAYALYSDMPETGSFSCSNDILNRMQRCIQWGAKSNFMDIPTDCPQRDERLGWTGDIALFSPAAAWNFDTSRFFDKWLMDVRAEQGHGGGIPMIIPAVKIKGQFEMQHPMAVDHWGDACILVPWAEYRARGNKEVLRQMYGTMKHYLKACTFWAGLSGAGEHRYIWKLLFHYGDWCAPDTDYRGWLRRGKWTATACLAHSCQIVSEIAGILGETHDAAYYRELSQKTAKAYRDILMTQDAHLKGEEFQTGYILPLYYQLLEEQDSRLAAEHLDKLVRDNNYHIGTGFPGTPYALFALADHGFLEDAYKMLLNEDCPSWLYEIRTGGTTFWERWDALREDGSCNLGEENGSGGMVSFNHYAAGAAGDFLYRRIAGIASLEAGYKKVRIAPKPGGGLQWASGSVTTPYGVIASRWDIRGDTFLLDIRIPAGVTCEVRMPDGQKITTGSGNWKYVGKTVMEA